MVLCNGPTGSQKGRYQNRAHSTHGRKGHVGDEPQRLTRVTIRHGALTYLGNRCTAPVKELHGFCVGLAV